MKLTLNEAIKLKKDLIDGLINDNYSIKQFNSILKPNKRPFNIRRLEKQMKDNRKKLVALKIAIQEANLETPIENQEKSIAFLIYTLSELKAEYNNLKSLNTKEGTFVDKKTGDKDKYNCVIDIKEVADRTVLLKKEISLIENKLERLNLSKTVEI